MAFNRIKRTRVPDQIATRIREAILGGRFDPGDNLPAERDLAEQFGVNRSSIREALRRLEAWGLVEIRHGGGTRVADFLATAGLQLLPFLIAPGGRLDPKLLGDLLELRVVLLGWTARRAAERADERDVAELEQRLETLEAAIEASDIAAIQRADFDFYERLVAVTDNRVLGLLANAIRRVYLENRELFEALYQGDGFDTTFHRRALDAIAAHRPDEACQALTAYGKSVIP